MNKYTIYHDGLLDRYLSSEDADLMLANTLDNLLSRGFNVDISLIELSKRSEGYLFTITYVVKETDVKVSIDYEGEIRDSIIDQIRAL